LNEGVLARERYVLREPTDQMRCVHLLRNHRYPNYFMRRVITDLLPHFYAHVRFLLGRVCTQDILLKYRVLCKSFLWYAVEILLIGRLLCCAQLLHAHIHMDETHKIYDTAHMYKTLNIQDWHRNGDMRDKMLSKFYKIPYKEIIHIFSTCVPYSFLF
jgi:hypothetical protein